MKTQPTHTPTPWKVSPPLGEGAIQIRSEKINEYGNFIVAEIPWREVTHHMQPAEDKANAAFIVRAANAHEELLEALQRIACLAFNAPESEKDACAKIHDLAERTIERAEGRS